ncbi:MAG: glycosyltransferase [Sulfurimonas sp.]|uniref:glycosyltransferase n=1 Tax=Sulfurimonas sp. TaxID=2022749 RepID=UPI00261FB20D|nr:glycosyltransferase [Sulfurimonas sp.]MDD5373386.1 glycosyltransferase [Sulfurimonas sp.]
MHRYKKYLSLIKSNPKLVVLFAKDMFRHGVRSSIRKAKRKANEKKADEHKALENFSDIIEKFDTQMKHKNICFDETIDILIPVYNGFEFLEPLFESIVKNSSLKYRLIIINDCSPDKRVDDFLQKFIEKNRDLIEIIYIQNEENLGFLKSVNRAAKKVQNHFVLLNTDTEVPPFWLERLMNPIINGENIATTTPMTNSGEICSFPRWLSDNKIYRGLDVAVVDKQFSYVSFEKNSISVPTGVGFCMGVNKNVYDKIGMFDEIFGKGYGEENDWCMRAIEVGYKNIIVPNLFVYHKHGGSFLSSEKKELIGRNLQILCKKHPSYNGLVQDLIEKNPLKEVREFLEILITFNTSKKNILIIDHELGGGTSIYRNERVNQYLKNEENVVLFSYNFLLNSYKISFYLSENEVFFYTSCGFDDIRKINDFIKIDEIFVNSLVSFKSTYGMLKEIIEFKEKSGAKLVLPIHDFYCICPSYTLLNDKNRYCHTPKDFNVCNQCLQNNSGDFRTFNSSRVNMNEWREEWEKIINAADTILCFSNSSAQIIQNVYDVREKIEIIPHTVGNLPKVEIPKIIDNGINIAVIGGINLAKGSLIIKDMIGIIEKNKYNINVTVIGELDLNLKSGHLKVHGRYQRDDLAELMGKYNINACLIPSIWPETFSYTTEEIMMMDMPLFIFDLGAPAERVKKYSKGYVIDKIDAYATLDAIKKFFGSKD